VVSIPACHAGDRGSIPRRRVSLFLRFLKNVVRIVQLFMHYARSGFCFFLGLRRRIDTTDLENISVSYSIHDLRGTFKTV
jgi:hypothetical protein